MKLDVIGAIEACYAGEEQDAGWLRGIVEALAPLDQGIGMFAQVFRMEPDGRRSVAASFAAPSLCPGILDRVDTSFSSSTCPPEMWAATAPVDFALRRARRVGPAARREVERLFACEGVQDTLGVFGAEPDGLIALVAAPIRVGGRVPAPQTLHQLRMFSAHLGASMRLRRALGATAPEGVLDPSGRVLDAAHAAGRAERESLADAVRRLDRARGALRHSDPDEAILLWQGLVEGRWSLVDRIERDGRRYVLARRNAPDVRDPKALTERERAVVALAALGHQNKLIAYALGLCPSAIATHLASARRKLRLGSRAELVHEFAALVQAEGGRDTGA
jgi:DNA-binding CsgD family transcriptional regulator